jgi:CRP/FNR family transcriptional regulator, dissimilatory nitrate respiration regulator
MVALDLTTPQIVEIMGRLPYFQELGTDELSRLADGAQEIVLKKKEILFREGDPADALYTVVSGSIKLAIGHARNQEKVIDIIGRGQCFGEIPMFLQSPCPSTAQAIEDSYLLSIKCSALMEALSHNCHLAGKMLAGVCRRMHTLIKDIDNCHLRSSSQRLASFLLQHRPDLHARHYDVILPGSKNDVAGILGLTRETFSRTLHQLEEENIIRVTGHQIRILDVEKLESYNGWQRMDKFPAARET